VAQRIFLTFRELRDSAGKNILYKFAEDQAQEGEKVTNFIEKWTGDIAAVTDSGGNKVERAVLEAKEKVDKAFREFMSEKKFKEYLKSIGPIAEADLLETLNKLKKQATDVLGGDAGTRAAKTRDIAMLAASVKVDNLRRDIEEMQKQAAIPVKWAWNEHEVDRMILSLKNEMTLKKELDRIESARKLHALDKDQGMGDTEASLEEWKARFAYEETNRKIREKRIRQRST